MTSTTTNRDKKTGQYNHGFDKVCRVCGHTKGEHLAEYPYPQDEGFDCPGFKAVRA